MYSYIKGTVTVINSDSIVIENNSIGYLIKVPNVYEYKINDNLTCYVYFHIREELQELYGFKQVEYRDMFIKLLKVKGLGPKGALAILASATIDELVQNIESNNSLYFKKFPGIGPKSSQQIILDLKGKVDFDNNLVPSKFKDVESALKSLGYTSVEIKKVIKNLPNDDQKSTSELVKIALRMVTSFK